MEGSMGSDGEPEVVGDRGQIYAMKLGARWGPEKQTGMVQMGEDGKTMGPDRETDGGARYGTGGDR